FIPFLSAVYKFPDTVQQFLNVVVTGNSFRAFIVEKIGEYARGFRNFLRNVEGIFFAQILPESFYHSCEMIDLVHHSCAQSQMVLWKVGDDLPDAHIFLLGSK